MKVFVESENLSRFDDELTASLERSTRRLANAGVQSTTPAWPLQAFRKPRVAGPEEDILAKRITAAHFYEALDGQSIVVQFRHGDEDETLVNLPVEAARKIIGMTRNRLAFRS